MQYIGAGPSLEAVFLIINGALKHPIRRANISVNFCCLNHLCAVVEVLARTMDKTASAILAPVFDSLDRCMSGIQDQGQANGSNLVQILAVGEAAAQQRLDNYLLARLKGAPKSLIYRIIRRGEVRINGKRAKPDTRLEPGDKVRVPPLRLAAPGEEPVVGKQLQESLRAAILYEDEELLVLNKPAGLAVHGGSGMKTGIIEALRSMMPQTPGLELVHRLDKGTSGCLLLSKTGKARRALTEAFREQTVHKTYHLLVAGAWPEKLRKVELALQRQPERSGERKVEADPQGKSATTLFRVLRSFHKKATLLEALPATGRTHQIRVHATAQGHPLLGDDKYFNEASVLLSKQLGVKRLCLHAAALEFTHPSTGQRAKMEAPADESFTRVLQRLEAGD
jgi:23S rRNA pseudouridine955/2504/2580 synthase